MLQKRRPTNTRRSLWGGADRAAAAAPSAPRMTPLEVTAAANRTARATDAPSVSGGSPSGCAPPATVAAVVGNATGEDWQAFVLDRIAAWAEGYFDASDAGARSPWRGQSAYAAWRGEAELDRTPEILGVRGFRGIVRTLPRDASGLLVRAAHDLELHGLTFQRYQQRLIATVADWAAHARRHGGHGVSAGSADFDVKEVLAIRAAWDLALHDAFGTRHRGIIATLRQRLAAPVHDDSSRVGHHA